MDSISPVLSAGLGANIPSRKADDPAKIRDAASQFESLLVGQILKSMHEDGEEGWLGSGEDETASSAMQMADEYLATAISRHGGLGLAKMIARQFEANSSNPATSPPESPGTPRTDR